MQNFLYQVLNEHFHVYFFTNRTYLLLPFKPSKDCIDIIETIKIQKIEYVSDHVRATEIDAIKKVLQLQTEELESLLYMYQITFMTLIGKIDGT